MAFRKYVCLSILYFELSYKLDFTGRNSLFKLETVESPIWYCSHTVQLKRRRETFTLHPQIHNTPSQANFPHGQKSLSCPPTGTPQKHNQVVLMPSSFLTFPPPAWCRGRAKVLLSATKHSRGPGPDFHTPFQAVQSAPAHPGEPKGIPAIGDAVISDVKHKIEVTEVSLFPPTGPGAESRPGLPRDSTEAQGDTNTIILQAETSGKKRGWNAHLGNSGSFRASELTTSLWEMFTTWEVVSSLSPTVNSGCVPPRGCSGLYGQVFDGDWGAWRHRAALSLQDIKIFALNLVLITRNILGSP